MSTTPLPVSSATNGKDAQRRVRYIRDVEKLEGIPPEQRAKLKKVATEYVFRVNDYYLGLIDWSDPGDPIKQLIIPREDELNEWGKLDASNEESVTVARGVQHKYRDTVLLLCNEVCGAYCRYCFRKRLFMDENEEVTNDVTAGFGVHHEASERAQRAAHRRRPAIEEHPPFGRDHRGAARYRARRDHPHRVQDARV